MASVCSLSMPVTASAQRWEMSLGRMSIDHSWPSNQTNSAEQFPTGIAWAGRHVWSSGLLVDLEISTGSEVSPGAICGGFLFDPERQCIPEPVRYSGGLVALSLGWRLQQDIAQDWSIGVRPRVGLGSAWASQSGQDTDRSYSDHPLTLVLGAALDGEYRLPGRPLAIIASLGADRLKPINIAACEDCWELVTDPLPQWSFSLGIGWIR